MTDEPQEHKEPRRWGWGCVVALLLLPVLYLASPPFVAMIFGKEVFDIAPGFWEPLKWLSRNSELYLTYLRMFWG